MLHQFCKTISLLVIGAATIALAGCGGGDGGSSSMMPPSDGSPGTHLPELPLQRPVDAAQAPIIDLDGTLHVGADVAPMAGALSSTGQHGEVAVSYGGVRDGIGVDDLIAYLSISAEDNGGDVLRFPHPGLFDFSEPTFRVFEEGTTPELISETVRAIQLINAALPHDWQLRFDPELIPIDETRYAGGEILIAFSAYEDWPIPADVNAAGVTQSQLGGGGVLVLGGQIWIDPSRAPGHLLTRVLVHEFIHALGYLAHPDPARFPDTVMLAQTSGDSPGQILYPLDRDGLLATYSRLNPGTPTEQIPERLGPWDDTSLHLRGDIDFSGGNVAFGVASRNGLAQPWAFGPTPRTTLSNNSVLSETVTWSGRLLGMTPALESVAGAADLAVELETLDGRLDFTDMESWGANTRPGMVGSGTTWGSGNLQYLLNVRGNTFVQTGGDEGTVTGAFFGPAHEAMGGVLERTDLTASFGGTR